jgi:hypothetical protein
MRGVFTVMLLFFMFRKTGTGQVRHCLRVFNTRLVQLALDA